MARGWGASSASLHVVLLFSVLMIGFVCVSSKTSPPPPPPSNDYPGFQEQVIVRPRRWRYSIQCSIQQLHSIVVFPDVPSLKMALTM